MENQTEKNDLAAAISRIADLAAEGHNADARVLEISTSDGVAQYPFPVLVGKPAPSGDVPFRSLLAEVRAAAALGRELRLAAAPRPDAREGVARHQSLASFTEHAERFKSPQSALWADLASRTLTSVLDYHPAGADSPPAWGRHRGEFVCPLSESWTAWGGLDGLDLTQEDFAALLDSRDYELVGGDLPVNGGPAPDPAALITLAGNLEIYSTATARRERDHATGRVRLSYTEDKGISGQVQVPRAFVISIPVFEGFQADRLEVRLQVNVKKEGTATFSIQIHRATTELRCAFDAICDAAKDQTDMPLFEGRPEARSLADVLNEERP